MVDEPEPDESDDSEPIDMTQKDGRWLDQDRPTYAKIPTAEEILDLLSTNEMEKLQEKINRRLDPGKSDSIDLTIFDGRWNEVDDPTYGKTPGIDATLDQLSEDGMKNFRNKISDRLEDAGDDDT